MGLQLFTDHLPGTMGAVYDCPKETNPLTWDWAFNKWMDARIYRKDGDASTRCQGVMGESLPRLATSLICEAFLAMKGDGGEIVFAWHWTVGGQVTYCLLHLDSLEIDNRCQPLESAGLLPDWFGVQPFNWDEAIAWTVMET